MSKPSIIPWLITLGMGIYIVVLNYRTENRAPEPPAYAFYDTTLVEVKVEPLMELHDVYGIYNNIIEGQRQIVKGVRSDSGVYHLAFRVNSPRPAFIYINDEALEVFITPESTLRLNVKVNRLNYLLDSVHFQGPEAIISEYYREKAKRFDIHFRSPRNTMVINDFCAYSQQLDSIANRELAFLNQYEYMTELPEWFIDFERSEVSYHKAYLKLSRAFNQNVPETCLDEVPINNEGAVFSFYYYLYLKSHFLYQMPSRRREAALVSSDSMTSAQVAMASQVLRGEMHDVFITRMIFDAINRKRFAQAGILVDRHKEGFNRKKYYRFLDYQLEKRQQEDLVLQEPG